MNNEINTDSNGKDNFPNKMNVNIESSSPD